MHSIDKKRICKRLYDLQKFSLRKIFIIIGVSHMSVKRWSLKSERELEKTNHMIKRKIQKSGTCTKRLCDCFRDGGKWMNNLKGSPSAPNISIKRRMKQFFDVILKNEHYTSETCPCCQKRSLQSFFQKRFLLVFWINNVVKVLIYEGIKVHDEMVSTVDNIPLSSKRVYISIAHMPFYFLTFFLVFG